MKKKFYIIPAFLAALSLASCGGNSNVTTTPSASEAPSVEPSTAPSVDNSVEYDADLQKVISAIYNSEEVLTGFNEQYYIYDNETIVHSYNRVLTLERGATINTNVVETIGKLSLSGNGLEETTVSYYTIGETKYNENGTTTSYNVPTYFLTFVLAEEFLAEDYSLEINNENYTLSANVKNSYVSSLFINKSITGLASLEISISIVNSRLTSFEANYTFDNGLTAKTTINYNYQV